MYYLHYVLHTSRSPAEIYAVLTKGIKREGAIVNAGFAEGPFPTEQSARHRAAMMNARLI